MITMGGKNWPAAVPVLTPAQLSDGTVINLLARSEGQVIYVAAVYLSPGAAPTLTYGRAQLSAIQPLIPMPERLSSSP